MLKRIPKSDISIRPFKAYKEWSFESGSQQNAMSSSFEFNERVLVYTANSNFAVDEYVTMSYISPSTPSGSIDIYEYYPKSIYGQLRAQFYNGNEDNPFLRFGSKTNTYETGSLVKDRYLSNDAKIISIPQIYVGEGIKKGSVILTDTNGEYVDDSFGNLISATGDTITFTNIDLIAGTGIFTDLAGNTYNVEFPTFFFDLMTDTIYMEYDNHSYQAIVVSFNLESGELVANNIDFLLPSAAVEKVGNVFYQQGLIIISRKTDKILNSNWNLSYKSTETIYENEYLLIVNQDEFNVSQNPTAVVEIGKETGYITGSDNKTYKVVTNPGVKYIRKKSTLENGNILDYTYSGSISSSITNTWISGGFEHYDLSSSVDSTGSFLAPFITTIGLYDDNCDLVAVAKLPQPIKSEHDIPVNFIVRFDT